MPPQHMSTSSTVSRLSGYQMSQCQSWVKMCVLVSWRAWSTFHRCVLSRMRQKGLNSPALTKHLRNVCHEVPPRLVLQPFRTTLLDIPHAALNGKFFCKKGVSFNACVRLVLPLLKFPCWLMSGAHAVPLCWSSFFSRVLLQAQGNSLFMRLPPI